MAEREAEILRRHELRLLRCTLLPPPSDSSHFKHSDDFAASLPPLHALISNFLTSVESGDYIGALSSEAARLVLDSPDSDLSAHSPDRVYAELLDRVESFVNEPSIDEAEKACRVFLVVCVAVAALFWFTQCNLTGPLDGLPKRPLPMKACWEGSEMVEWENWARNQLMAAGSNLLGKFSYLQYIVFAKMLLLKTRDLLFEASVMSTFKIKSISWWLFRALLIHQRILDERSSSLFDLLQVLKGENSDHFGSLEKVTSYWGDQLQDGEASTIVSMVHLEAGVLEYIYGRLDPCRLEFESAELDAGLQLSVTGILGLQTVHQALEAIKMVLNMTNNKRINVELLEKIMQYLETDENLRGNEHLMEFLGKILQQIFVLSCLRIRESSICPSMVGESLPEFDNREDVLQPLFSASNSSSLRDALEILIQASRDAVGRAELALRNILPTVLKLVESLYRTSRRDYLVQSFKLLRNLCAGEVGNQNSFLERNGIEIVLTVLRSAALASDMDFGIIRFGLQVLANVSLAGAEHQQVIWLKLFPSEFFMLASIPSQETSDPLCMILHSCCDGRPGLATELCSDSGLPIVPGLIRTVASVGFREDWFKLLLSRLCLEDIHFPALFHKLCENNASENREDTGLGDNCFSSEQAFLLSIISEILNERIDELRVPDDLALCVLEIFKRSLTIVDFATKSKSGLSTGSTSVDVMGYSLIILRDICARDSVGDLKKDSADAGMLLFNELLDVLLSLLRDLELPSTIRKALKDGENQELISRSSKLCPYKGFRRDLVVVIGNCAYRRKHIQDEIRQKNGIPLLLQQCVTDDDNPYLREWGIWSVRNLLECNAENQQSVADLQLQEAVDTPELTELGLRVEVDQNIRRAKLVNITGSYQKPVA